LGNKRTKMDYKFENGFCDSCKSNLHPLAEEIAGPGVEFGSDKWKEAFEKAKNQLTKKVVVFFPGMHDSEFDEYNDDLKQKICADCLKKIIEEMENKNEQPRVI
jgi:hypothetical protein